MFVIITKHFISIIKIGSNNETICLANSNQM